MNKWLHKLHSVAALVALLPLMLICLSGSVLVFKYELDLALNGVDADLAPDSGRLDTDLLVASVRSSLPDYEVVGWIFPEDVKRPDLVYLIKKGSSEWFCVHLDPYLGQVLSEPLLRGVEFTDWLLELHHTLLINEVGLLVAAACAAVLLLLGVTGVVLHRRFWKNFLTLRRQARLVLYLSDLHKFVGIVSAPVLMVLGFTGLWWNILSFQYEGRESQLSRDPHFMTTRLYSGDISLSALLREAESEIEGFRVTYLSLPSEPGRLIWVRGSVPSVNIFSGPYSSSLSFSPATGERVSSYDVREQGIARRVTDSYRRLHYGDFAGFTSRLLWCVLGAAPILLAVTGISLWWRRRPQRRRRKLKRRQAATLSRACQH